MTRGFALLLTTCLAALPAAIGCRRDPNMDAYLNKVFSQQRALEDRLNELSYEHSATVDKLAAAEDKNKELLRELGRSDGDDRPSSIRRPRQPANQPSDPDSTSPPALTPPSIERGEEFTPTSGRKRGVRVAPANTSADRSSGLSPNGENAGRPSDMHVTHIVLNPYLTQGHDFDGEPGDDGVSLAIEPRNAVDSYVARPGKVSVVIIDPEAEGEEGRIARWDFDSEEVARRLKTPSGRQGIVFKLPWPKEPPIRANLRLFARYVTDEGEKLEADRPIFLNLPGQFSHRWTPKSSRPVQDLLPERSDALVERAAPPDVPASSGAMTGVDPPAAGRSDESPDQRQARLPGYLTPTPLPANENQESPMPRKPPARPQWSPYR